MASKADKAEAIQKDQKMERNFYIIGRSKRQPDLKSQMPKNLGMGQISLKRNPVKIRNGISLKDLNSHPIK